MAAILEMIVTSQLGHRWSDLDKIWYAVRELHANDDENVKVEPEVEFQYGGHLFSETGNSNISAADRAILAKLSANIFGTYAISHRNRKWK